MSKSKAKGTAAETALVKYLRDRGFNARRNPLMGKADRGDIAIEGMDIVIEVKNQKALSIPEWLRELDAEKINAESRNGILVVKPRGVGLDNAGKWWVIQRLEDYDL
jgi:Holliday junction resolvase